MRQIHTFFLVAVSLLFLVSCSATKNISQTRHPKQDLQFMDGVAITNGSNALQLEQEKQTYQAKKAKPYGDEEAASIDDNPIELVQNKILVEFIEDWYGTPYKYGGECKEGIDCSAFVQELYQDVYHIQLLRTASQQFATSGHVPQWEKLKEGDLVFFKIHSRHISHVGVYLGDGKFVHASFSSGVMISDLRDRYWTKYFACGGIVQG